MLRIQIHRIIFIVFLLCFVSAGTLNASSATVFVSATVLPWVNMDIRQHQRDFTITAGDIERNYIDIPYSATVDVETNVSVLILTLSSAGDERIVASFSGENRFESSLEIALSEDEKYSRHITRDLDFRILLNSDSHVGTQVLDAWINVQAF